MDGGGGKLCGIMEELGMAVTDFKLGRGGQKGIGKFLQGGGAGDTPVRGGDLGADPKDRAGAVELHSQGRVQDHWETAVERGWWAMDLSSSEGSHARGGVRRDLEGLHKEAEYDRAIDCDATDSGPM